LVPIIILLVQSLWFIIFGGGVFFGCIILLWLTVPCGIKTIYVGIKASAFPSAGTSPHIGLLGELCQY